MYDLPRLGWLQFQSLCQQLVVPCGIAPERWQGSAHSFAWVAVPAGTHGSGLPGFPAPGAAFDVLCVHLPADAQRSAGRRLAARLHDARHAGALRGGRPTVVLTSAPLAPADVEDATGDASEPLTIIGAAELSALVDADAELRLRCPAVLGTREPETLIERDAASRSRFDVAGAAQLARVFVATRAYRRAIDVLQSHRFAVLTGPPEMGKSAIARMIGFALLTRGWEVHECERPERLWEVYAADRPQLFIADDAFGSTEYRPDAAERWAGQLYRALHRMDDTHWLVWTSRPAPLKAALDRIHREHGVEQFPQPAEVNVDAARLDVAEKALILFRHAGAVAPGPAAVTLVQQYGWEIVSHEHFTPERIRRFASQRLPQLGQRSIDAHGTIADAVANEIREPTRAMAASLGALDPRYRAVLDGMLDFPAGPVSYRELVIAARRHANASMGATAEALIDRLADHFLRHTAADRVDWVHPSWRDLVIDDIASNAAHRNRFLQSCTLDGLLLAISTGGGAAGERRLPFMVSDADWDTLTARLVDMLPSLSSPDAHRLLDALAAAEAECRHVDTHHAGWEHTELVALSQQLLGELRRQWDRSGAPIPVSLLEAWYHLAARVGQIETPQLAATFVELLPSGEPSGSELFDTIDWLVLLRLGLQHAPPEVERIMDATTRRDVLGRICQSSAAEASPEVADAIRKLSPYLDEKSWQLCEPMAHLHQTPRRRAPHMADAPRFASALEPPDRDLVARVLLDLSQDG